MQQFVNIHRHRVGRCAPRLLAVSAADGAVWFVAAQNGFVSEGSPCGAEPTVLLIQKCRSGATLSP
jgi:hypothetical protein